MAIRPPSTTRITGRTGSAPPYLELETPRATRASTTIAMADYEMEEYVYQLNYQSAKIAKEAALKYSKITPEKPRFVAGSIGPTNRTASMSPDVNDPGFRAITFDDLVKAYSEQINALIDGGVDILLIETIFDTLNAKAALYAIDEIKKEKSGVSLVKYKLPIE